MNLYGGGLISAFTHRQTRTSTIRCFLSWSENLFVGSTLSTPVASIPPLSRGSGWFPTIFGGGGSSSWMPQEGGAIQFDVPGNELYLLYDINAKTWSWLMSRPSALMTNSTSGDFLFEDTISCLVAVYSQDATFVRWMPGLVDIPLTTLEQPIVNGPRSTFDALTGMKSRLQSDVSPLQRFINNPFDITRTLSGGGGRNT